MREYEAARNGNKGADEVNEIVPTQTNLADRPNDPVKTESAKVTSHDDATRTSGLLLYLGLGEVAGKGELMQVDAKGNVEARVALPSTPYGVDVSRNYVFAALPRAERVVRIDAEHKLVRVLSGRAIDVAVSNQGHLAVADNVEDKITVLKSPGPSETMMPFPPSPRSLPNFSVAFTANGKIVVGTSNPRGIYSMQPNAADAVPVFDADSRVAADPTSNRWACVTELVPDGRATVQVFEGKTHMNAVALPADYRRYRGGLVSFTWDGDIVVAVYDQDRSMNSVASIWIRSKLNCFSRGKINV